MPIALNRGILLRVRESLRPADAPMETAVSAAQLPRSADRPEPRFGPGGRLRAALASYRFRVVGSFILLFAIGTAGTVLVVEQLLLQRVDDDIQRALAQESDEFRSLATGNDPVTGQPFGTDIARVFDVFLQRNIPNRNEVLVTFLDGRLYRTSTVPVPYALEQDPQFLESAANASQAGVRRLNTEVGAVDYVAVPVRVAGQPRGVFAVAIFRDLERAQHADLLPAALSVGVILLILGSILGWRLADRVLAPVLRTAATARTISESDLSQRVEVRGHDEVAELARTFNEMLDRISTAFDDQRRFLDDVGHELRTPLTIVRGHLELMEEGTPDERDRTRELVLDELDRMSRLVSDLMVLAQSNRPDFLRRGNVDAADLLQRVLEKASVLGNRRWSIEVARSRPIVVDGQRITQAMLQLATNAVSHTREGDEIVIGGDVDDLEARFWVRDSGAGIPESEQRSIFHRFYRGKGQSRATGGGLGLSIVQAIAEVHGGRVDVASRPGSGAIFTIVIPSTGVMISA
jgi:two-component system OmpR family sensor kinase